MKYFKITCDTPYCGTEMTDYQKAEKAEDLKEYAEELNRANAESYEYLVSGWNDENFEGLTEEERQEELDNYYADCGYYIKEVSKEEFEENT